MFFNEERISHFKPHQICKRGVERTFQVVKPLQRMTTLDNVIASEFLGAKNKAQAEEMAIEALKFTGLYEDRNIISKGLPRAYYLSAELPHYELNFNKLSSKNRPPFVLVFSNSLHFAKFPCLSTRIISVQIVYIWRLNLILNIRWIYTNDLLNPNKGRNSIRLEVFKN